MFSNNVLCSHKCPSHLPTEKKATETFARQCAVVLPSSGGFQHSISKEGQSKQGEKSLAQMSIKRKTMDTKINL